MTRCPQAILEVTIEHGGRVQRGFAGDCLPLSWFDKTPGKGFDEQIQDMFRAIRDAQSAFAHELTRPAAFFPAWHAAHEETHRQGQLQGLTPLVASFGSSLLERALLDAMARAAAISFADAVRSNLYGIQPERVHPRLRGLVPRDWLPAKSRERIFVRHTVGLADPITASECNDASRPDARPLALEEYVRQCGIRYFKVKVANQPEQDLDRLERLACVIESARGNDYALTLDGNELFESVAEFDALIERIESRPSLGVLWRNVLAIEQPLYRGISLSPEHAGAIRALSRRKPVIIDESDGQLDSYAAAIECGYRGVSSKGCKGAIKSLLNAGLTWQLNDRGRKTEYLMTGEDLCSVGIVPVQSDMCLVATLGLEHIERNGHHFHPGLSYLPREQQEAALAAHGDLYARLGDTIVPNVIDGQFTIRSLQCIGMGFAVEPDLATMASPESWRYESLGL